METVTNAASTAANTVVQTATNLIYGNQQSGTEPRSGETGTGSQPYDAGNVDGVPGNPGQNATSTTGSSNLTGSTGADTTGLTSSASHTNTNPTTSTTGATGDFGSSSGNTYTRSHSSNVDSATTGPTTSSTTPGSHSTTTGTNPRSDTATGAVDSPGALESQKNETADTNAGGFGTTNPSVSADPSSGQKPEQSHQGAGRPQEVPSGGVGTTGPNAAKKLSPEEEEQQRGERAMANRSPDDHSGEPLKIHDDAYDAEMRKTDRSKSISQEGGGELGKEKGTGEQYVKTSGLKADGGDFDATKPGAGKEADRLLEEKGIKKSDSNKGAPQDLSGGTGSHETEGEKVSKLAKLKEKLHIGSKKE